MDDIAVFADRKPRLYRTLAAVRDLLQSNLRLELRAERTRLMPVTQGIPFLGFRVFPGVVRLDGRKWARLRRRVRSREADYKLGAIGEDELAQAVQSMVGHVSHIDSLQARKQLFALSSGLG